MTLYGQFSFPEKTHTHTHCKGNLKRNGRENETKQPRNFEKCNWASDVSSNCECMCMRLWIKRAIQCSGIFGNEKAKWTKWEEGEKAEEKFTLTMQQAYQKGLTILRLVFPIEMVCAPFAVHCLLFTFFLLFLCCCCFCLFLFCIYTIRAWNSMSVCVHRIETSSCSFLQI